MGGVVGGLLGLMLANRLSVRKNTLNRIFAGLIFAVAAYVLYRSGPRSWRSDHTVAARALGLAVPPTLLSRDEEAACCGA